MCTYTVHSEVLFLWKYFGITLLLPCLAKLHFACHSDAGKSNAVAFNYTLSSTVAFLYHTICSILALLCFNMQVAIRTHVIRMLEFLFLDVVVKY